MIINYSLKESTNIYQKTLKTLYCGFEECKKNHSWGPLARENYLIHFVVSGKGIFRYKNKEYEIEKNHAFMAEPYESIYYKASSNNPWTYAWIGFKGEASKNILDIIGFKNKYVIETSVSHDYYNYLLNYSSGNTGGVLNEFEMNNITNYLLSLFVNSQKSQNISRKDIYLDQALNFIHSNYMKPITIQKMSQDLGISRKYLYKIFKDKINASPKQYLTNYRLEKAIVFMKKSDITIAEVARSVGYLDQLNFSKIFTKKYHRPPSEFL